MKIKSTIQFWVRTSLTLERKCLGKLKGYTLMELLVVLIIIGILILIAYPNLMPLISSAKSTEAKTQLEHVYTLQKSYFFQHAKYSENLEKIGFEQVKLSNQEGGNANYQIKISKSGVNSFTAQAISITDFDGDGNFNVWEINQEKQLTEITPD